MHWIKLIQVLVAIADLWMGGHVIHFSFLTSSCLVFLITLCWVIQESPFDAFRFETKGCHNGNMDTRQFEFVLLDDPFLSSFAESADIEAFSEHFRLVDDHPSAAVVFPNLGHDAVLVVPQPLSSIEDVKHTYGHCANFVRYAPEAQIRSLWKMVATAYLSRVEEKDGESVWLSTAGTGMRWLHFRLDDRPKYYQYRPFTREK
jgi:hypothetical protein